MRRCFRSVTAFVLAGSGLVAAPPLPVAAEVAQAAPPPSSTADDLSQLKRDLEALRQDYAGRVAAIEARIAALEGRTAEAAVGRRSAPGGAAGRLPEPRLSRRRRRARARRCSTPTWPRSATSSGPPASRREAESRRSTCRKRSSPSRPWSTPTRGPTSSSRWARRRWPSRRATSPSRRSPAASSTKVGKMRDAFGKVNPQHPHTLPLVDRPFVTRNLTGGEDGLADAGISVARLIPNPWLFLEATGQVYQGNSEVFKAPTRGDLAYVGHLRAYRDVGESTNVDLGGSIAYGHNGVDRRHHDAPPRRRRHAALEAPAPLDLHALPRPGRGHLEPGRGAGRRPRRGGRLRLPRVPVRPPLDRRPALRQLRAGDVPRAARQGRLVHPDLQAERVQPRPRPVPPHDASPAPTARRTSCSSSSCSRSAPTAPIPSDRGRHETPEASLALAVLAAAPPAARRRQRHDRHRGPGRPHPPGRWRQGQGRVHRPGLPGPALRRGQAQLHPEAREGRPARRRRPRARDRLAAAAHPAEPQREDPGGGRRATSTPRSP